MDARCDEVIGICDLQGVRLVPIMHSAEERHSGDGFSVSGFWRLQRHEKRSNHSHSHCDDAKQRDRADKGKSQANHEKADGEQGRV